MISWISGVTDIHHYAQLIDWVGVSITFCLGWAWAPIFLISTSQVVIAHVGYHTQPLAEFLIGNLCPSPGVYFLDLSSPVLCPPHSQESICFGIPKFSVPTP
jgi:hypothetical protein